MFLSSNEIPIAFRAEAMMKSFLAAARVCLVGTRSLKLYHMIYIRHPRSLLTLRYFCHGLPSRSPPCEPASDNFSSYGYIAEQKERVFGEGAEDEIL